MPQTIIILRITSNDPTAPDAEQVAAQLRDDYSDVGVECTVEILPSEPIMQH